MGELQWALLIVCVVLVVALYVLSRRSGAALGSEEDKHSLFKRDSGGDQMDLLTPRPDSSYDEFGVGRKRTRGDSDSGPSITPNPPPRQEPDAVREPPEPSMATLLHPLPGQSHVAPRRAEPAVNRAPVDGPTENKLIALIVAPKEETDILGPQLHDALNEMGLEFGEGQVYHRTIGGRIVYTVSSLLKPGTLIPDEADDFATKGLTVFLNLPGPVLPVVALDDMLATTLKIAEALKCDIYNAKREHLNKEVGAALRQDVEDWAKARKLV